MSGQLMKASDEDVREYVASCQKALDIAHVCQQLDEHPDAGAAVRYLESFLWKARLEQMGDGSDTWPVRAVTPLQ
jgi:hypothetical protein